MTAHSTSTSTTEPAVYGATAPLVLIKDSNGATHHVYDGEPVPEHAAPGEVKRPLGLGFITAA